MLLAQGRGWKWAGAAMACALLAACASPRHTPAPVEDRTARHGAPVEPGRVATAPAPAVNDNAGKAGYYTVKPGDTLIRIALESGQNWKDIARWNGLENPNVIEVGQVLRVVPPGAVETAAPRTMPPASAASAPVAAASAATAASAPRPSSSAASTTAPVPAEEEVAWAWPTAAGTSVLAGFDEQKNKGLDLGGKAGDPVLAAADGRVVYAGAGLRGYGNLIILKHNNTYLTAYAHNQSLLVKEDQSVRKGQKIAEMGSSDADRVKLHFEIRRQGKPVDPSRYLPAR
ncbi:peptidoglycan DD-metalloendopeptidase family protein [Ramlibacter sp. XY19]|uniref:peptidoglycan DD-metalloendopeptidase family protein n=1 Tax=Ramlibacter paludis TaxID=2908000 RepID=UPI0023DB258F|nr:peptidoglycan DD-metalloendopeptidase family protein [Ramlibacter paludis]MCG2592605.1 peptidoglycan DD-metalloendopeptidase family protein [Ramlibacter paludis]